MRCVPLEPLERTPLPAPLDRTLPRLRGYDVLAIIGRGGMGLVYEARHRELNRRVAVKMLRGEALEDPIYRERFRHEAEAIAQLQHPNIIQVFEVGATEPVSGAPEGQPFIALEFVDGGSLAQRARGPQSPAFAASVLEPVARAAHAAHQLGIVHRDLKPANVLLTRDGTPKVADFGIAKQMGAEARSVTRAGTVMGTPEYMAPEQFEGETAVPSIDIYALGVMLYELLTGRVPLHGATFADTMLLALQQEPVPPSRLQPGVPRDLETICLKCLEKDPRKRYRTARELADDLARWRAGEPILARPLGPIGRAARWARRNPTVAALAALVVLVSTAGAAGIVWQWHDARANALKAIENARQALSEKALADAARRLAELERDACRVRSAATALRIHDAATARLALESVPEGSRNWTWFAMHSQLDRAEYTHVFGHNMHREIDARGRWIALRSTEGSARMWYPDVREMKPVPLAAPLERVRPAPDGTVVACVPKDRSDVVLCEPLTGRVGATLPGLSGRVAMLQFSHCGTRLLAASPQQVRAWSVPGGRELWRLDLPPGLQPLTTCADLSALVAMRRNSELIVLCTETGRERCALAPPGVHVLKAELSPDGARLVVGEGFPSNAVRLYDARTGARLGDLLGHENEPQCATFSPDGTKLVTTSSDRSARVWDVTASGPPAGSRLLCLLRGHNHWVTDAQFSACGTRVVTSGFDQTVRVWDTLTGTPIAVLMGHSNVSGPVAFRPDGSVLSTSADGQLKHWSVREATGESALRGHKRFVYDCAFLPDGRTLVSSGWDGTARVWDADTGREVRALHHGRAGAVASVAASPDGRTIATYARNESNDQQCPDNGVYLWDARTGERLHFWPLATLGWFDSRLAFSKCGTKLASGTSGGPVRVWDVASRAQIHELKSEQPARSVAFSPCGTKLAVGYAYGGSSLRVWDLTTGTVARRFVTPDCITNALAWSADGTRIASGTDHWHAYVWDADTGRQVSRELKHSGNVYGVAFSEDGALVTGCADGIVRVWNPANGHLTAELLGHTEYVHQVALSPDGTRLATASGDKTLRIWDTKKPADRNRK